MKFQFPVMMIFGLLCMQAVNCCGQSSAKSNQRYGIHISYEVPIVNRDNSIDVKNVWYEIYYAGNIIIYKYPVVKLDVADHPSVTTYFIYHTDSLYGRIYSEERFNAFNGKRFRVDSTTQRIELDNSNLQNIVVGLRPDSINRLPNGEVVKIFSIPTSSSYPEKFKVYLYYSETLNQVTYSLARQLDSFENRKLYHIRNVGAGYYYEKEKVKMPAREYVIKLTSVDLPKDSSIDRLIKQYQQQE